VRSYATNPQNGFEGLVPVEGISYLICRKDWECGTQMRGNLKLETSALRGIPEINLFHKLHFEICLLTK